MVEFKVRNSKKTTQSPRHCPYHKKPNKLLSTCGNRQNHIKYILRKKYQGIEPPTVRHESDFDAGAKYHVAASVPYIRYFVAHILEYQFYKTMCLESKQYEQGNPDLPLFKCDFSHGPDAAAAGAKLK